MATITNRGPYQFQAQVRLTGYPHQTETFTTKPEARAWAAQVESEMARGVFVDRTALKKTTFGDILARYLREVTIKHRGHKVERSRIASMQQHPLAKRSLANLRSSDFSDYREERLTSVMADTVRRELSIITQVLKVARRDWSLPIPKDLLDISWPAKGKERERRLNDGEEEALLRAATQSRATTLSFCITLAIETGMRAGEIVPLTWEQIDLAHKVIRLDVTKNGDSRLVPLSERAESVIRALPRPILGGRLMSFHDSQGLSIAFRRTCARAGITELRFHDLRHEAASRLAPKMQPIMLAKVMGWRTLQMAMRYYQAKPNELVNAVRAAA